MSRFGVRRAHATAAARFKEPPLALWGRLANFTEAHAGEGASVEVLVPGESRWIRREPHSLGFVEQLSQLSEGRLAYRARVPGGSSADDLDGVVRVSAEGGVSLVTWSTEAVADWDAPGRDTVRRWLEDRLRDAGGTVLAPLTMEVRLGDYREIARTGLDGAETATWSPTTATLVSGERDAVLIDALMTAEEADDLVDWIRGSGKRLRAVVVTHGHADHFFGLESVLRAFPDAAAYAVPDVAAQAGAQVGAVLRAHWESLFPGKLPASVSAPAPSPRATLELEGHPIHLFDAGPIGGRPTSIVSVRHLDAVIGGDLVYNRVHPWLIGTDRRDREQWTRSLDLIEALRPAWAIASHRHPAASSDSAADQVERLRSYLGDFDRALSESSDAVDLAGRMARKYPDFGNRSTLQASALAQFPGWEDLRPHADFPDLLSRRDDD